MCWVAQGASSARLAHESSRGAELDAQVAAGHVAVVEAEVAVAAEQEELLALEVGDGATHKPRARARTCTYGLWLQNWRSCPHWR